MKKILIPACIALAILASCLVPHKSDMVGAYPENLWTSPGHFSRPSTTREVLKWNRSEYGVVWAWLVHDSCTSEPAWYVRIEPRYLVLYSVVAFLGGLVTIALIGIQKKNAQQAVDGNPH